MERQNLILDLDDTLIRTGDLYSSVKNEFISFMSSIEFDFCDIDYIFESREQENINKYGYIPERYCISMLEVYNYCIYHQRLISKTNHLNVIRSIANRILNETPDPVEDLHETVNELIDFSKLFLISRGNESLQFKKIRDVGLDQFFTPLNTLIVKYKDKQVFSDFMKLHSLRKDITWSIGDSIKSDINPAIEIGVKCILISYPSTSYQWQQDCTSAISDDYIFVNKFKDVPSAIKVRIE